MLYVTHAIRQNRMKQLKTIALDNAEALVGFMLESHLMGATSQLGLLIPEVKSAARIATPTRPAAADSIIEAFRANYDGDSAYIINKSGHIVVYKSKAGNDVRGQDISYRPYFKEALKSNNSVYAAIPTTNDNGRALFFSAPIYIGNNRAGPVIGAVTIRIGMAQIDKRLSELPFSAVLISPQGVVMSTNRPDWLFHVTGPRPVSDERAMGLARDQQFSTHFKLNRPAPLPFDNNLATVNIANQNYGVVTVPVQWRGTDGPWSLTFLENTTQWYPRWIREIIFFISASAVALLFLWLRNIGLQQLQRKENFLRLKISKAEVETMNERLSEEVTTRTLLEKSLIDERDMLQALFDCMSEGVYTLNLDGTTSMCNPAGQKMLGYTLEEFVGKNVHNLIHHTHKNGQAYPIEECALRAACIDEKLHRGTDEIFWRKNGTSFPIDYVSSPLQRNGKIFGALVTFKDNTERLFAEQEIERARLAAETANQAKSAFLAMMSHEIRTPMNGIMSMAEMLNSTELTDDQHDMSSVIHSSTVALLTIINDILDFSKIEAGKLEIEKIPFSLINTIESIGELKIRRAENKKLSLVVDVDPTLPDQLIGDPTRVRQIILNLMSNAIKFTDNGEVSLKVDDISPVELRPHQRLIRFEITDTGIGLSTEQINKLFQPFHQADTSTSRKFGGTGLGLSICRQLSELMGGSIGVTSTIGEGSTFWFELPFDVDPATVDRPKFDISKACIVVVSMKDRAKNALTRKLAAANINDIHWVDSTNAINLCTKLSEQKNKTILVLINVSYDDFNAVKLGLTLTQRFSDHLKVVLLVSPKVASSIDLEKSSDFYAILSIPIRRHRLWHLIAASLELTELKTGPSTNRPEEFWAPPDMDTARAANAVILVAEDNLINQKVITRLLSRLGYAHEVVNNGQLALEEFKKKQYGLILTDFHMPSMDGFELAAAIRKLEKNTDKRVPILMLTADVLASNEKSPLGEVDGHLLKPIEFHNLLLALEKFLPQAYGLRSPSTNTSSVFNTTTTIKNLLIDPDIFDLKYFKAFFGGLNSEALDFLSNFLSDIPNMVEQLNTALNAGNVAEARDEAHALKGAALSVGAKRLGNLAGDIQNCLDQADIETARLINEVMTKTLDELKDTITPLFGIAQ